MSALRRFMSQRGKPTDIHSDNGTSFVGAYNDVDYGSVTMLMIQDLMFNSFIIYLIWLFIRYKTIEENNYTIVL